MKIFIENSAGTVIYNQPRIMSTEYYDEMKYIFIVDGDEVGFIDNVSMLLSLIQMDKDIALKEDFYKNYIVGEWGK